MHKRKSPDDHNGYRGFFVLVGDGSETGGRDELCVFSGNAISYSNYRLIKIIVAKAPGAQHRSVRASLDTACNNFASIVLSHRLILLKECQSLFKCRTHDPYVL